MLNDRENSKTLIRSLQNNICPDIHVVSLFLTGTRCLCANKNIPGINNGDARLGSNPEDGGSACRFAEV